MDESLLRLAIFGGVFLLCMVAEFARPKRPWRESRLRRWLINLGLIVLNTVFVRLTLGALAVTAAVWAEQENAGLFRWFAMEGPMAHILGFIILDAAIWFQHWLSHQWSWLWRLHRVHHMDLDLDVTTALRFHPIEIILSLLYKAALVILLGVDPLTVLVFEAVLNAAAIFTHANIRLPSGVDRVLRWLVCTPDMHRIHHSIYPSETNSNYGFFLSVWDRIFKVYSVEPKDSPETMVLGLEDYQHQQELGLKALLVSPFNSELKKTLRRE